MTKQKRNWIIGLILFAIVIVGSAVYFYIRHKNADNKQNESVKTTTTTESTNKNSVSQKPNTNNPKSNVAVDLSAVEALYQAKNYDQALIEIDKLANVNPTGEVLNLYGNILRDSGDTGAAQSKYEQAISLAPNLIVAYTNLATIYQQNGNIDKAKEILNQGLIANPGNADLQNSLAILEITPTTGN